MRFAIIEDGIVANIVLAEQEFAADQGWVEAVDGVGPGWFFNGVEFMPPAPSAPVVPQSVTMVQARLVLFANGILDDVETAINSLPSPAKEMALIEWNHRTEVRRESPLLAQLQPILDLNDEQIDAMFIAASAL